MTNNRSLAYDSCHQIQENIREQWEPSDGKQEILKFDFSSADEHLYCFGKITKLFVYISSSIKQGSNLHLPHRDVVQINY